MNRLKSKLAILGGHRAAADLQECMPVTTADLEAVRRSMMETPLTSLHGDGDVARFERAFAAYLQCDHTVAVTSGTSALHTAVAALDIGPGDEVITTIYSFVASVSAIVQQGATPVFCDIDSNTLNMDVDKCLALITPRTKAILVVHVFGKPADVLTLRKSCDERGIALIEDCAGALGAKVHDQHVGTIGDIGCFSFNIHKVLRTGEGGMLVTRDAKLDTVARELRVNGISKSTRCPNGIARLGYNYTMPQMIAALGRRQMELLPDIVARRNKNARQLRGICDVTPLTALPEQEETTPVGYWTPLLLPQELSPYKTNILKALRAEGVYAHTGYGEPLHRIEYLRKYSTPAGYPVGDSICPRVLVVDPSPWFSDAQMRSIVDAFNKVFSEIDEVKALAN